jgi:hypothetical protein
MNDEKIILPLNLQGETKHEAAIQETVNQLIQHLKEIFGQSYEISYDKIEEIEKDWSYEIRIRQGNKIGAAVDIKWPEDNPSVLEIEVDESSKLGMMILTGSGVSFMVIAVLMAINDIAPLAFLPGRRIAALLGGLIGLVLGMIIGLILKSLLLKGEKETNNKLTADVLAAVKTFSTT